MFICRERKEREREGERERWLLAYADIGTEILILKFVT